MMFAQPNNQNEKLEEKQIVRNLNLISARLREYN